MAKQHDKQFKLDAVQYYEELKLPPTKVGGIGHECPGLKVLM